MIEPDNKQLSVRRQCELLGLYRSVYYHKSKAKMIEDRDEMVALLVKVQTSRSRWMELAAPWTMFSSRGFGGQ